MEKIIISPWHLCRQHLAVIARKIKEVGIREVARKSKETHTIVARIVHDPSKVNINTLYNVANVVGMVFRLEVQENLPNTEKSKVASEARPKRQPRKNPTPRTRKPPTNLTRT